MADNLQQQQTLAGIAVIERRDIQQSHAIQEIQTQRSRMKNVINKSDIPDLYADFDVNFKFVTNYDKQPISGALRNYTPMIISLNIKNPPPALEFLINPKSLTITLNKMLRPQFTRSGWITQHPGDEMPSMDFAGSVGAFYNSKDGLVSPYYGFDDSIGRSTSAAYQWLIKLMSFYKNNGYNINSNDKLRIDSVGTVEIFYEGIFYIGSFRTFEFTEDENRPHTIDYTFNFKVREIK